VLEGKMEQRAKKARVVADMETSAAVLLGKGMSLNLF